MAQPSITLPTPQEAARILLERRIRKNKFSTYFPDEGPCRRELYPKQMEFFALGKEYKERLFMAANRCAGPWAPIETGHGERQFRELIGETGFDVRSWDGGSRCTRRAGPVFLRGIAPAFRLHLGNGQFFDCSCTHRVLMADGYWRTVDQLIRGASGLRLKRILPDLKASCDTDDRRDGGQLPCGQGNGREPLPSRFGALGRNLGVTPADAGESISSCKRHRLTPVHLSIPDGPDQIAALCDQFSDPSDCISAQWSSDLLREVLRFSRELNLERQGLGLEPGSPLYLQLPSESGYSGAGRTHSGCGTQSQTLRQSGFALDLVLSGAGFLAVDPYTEIFVPLDSPLLLGGTAIAYVVPLGWTPITDIEVTGTHNYFSSGLVNHNCGKSESGAYETTCHATGLYDPRWWKGRQFNEPTSGWACGTTSETTRDIVQEKLLGPIGAMGTGMIPGDLIINTTPRRSGLTGAVESIFVRHASGGVSTIGLKTYEQGRASFEGTSKHYAWLDEECEQAIYVEVLYRTLTTKGIVFTTFTPLKGMSDVVKSFLEPENEESRKSKVVIQAGWKHVPHLSEEEKEMLLATTPPYQLKARVEGEPSLGSGAIYPIAEDEITCKPFEIPDTWRKSFGMDVGYNCTAVVWGTQDPGSGVYYIWSEHYKRQGEPPVHAEAIKARGEWIPGVIDPACLGSSQVDGRNLMDVYRRCGIKLQKAENAVQAGIMEVWTLFVSGRLKIFNNCECLLGELRKYHRNEKGDIVKKDDHGVDALRYWVMSGRERMTLKPRPKPAPPKVGSDDGRGWMA